MNEIRKWKGSDIMPRPLFADLHLSNACEMACTGCAYQDDLTTPSDSMSWGDASEVVSDLIGFGTKAFDIAGGGEPLMLPYIGKLMNKIHVGGGKFGLITNGLKMDHKVQEYLVKYGSYVRISLEASNEQDYWNYKYVSSESWLTVIKNIQDLVRLRNEVGSPLEIGIKFAVGKSLCGHAHYYAGMMIGRALHVDSIQFKSLRHEPEELSLVGKQKEEGYFKDIIEQLYKENISLCSKTRHWIVPIGDKEVPQCWLNPLHTVVDPGGNIYLCCYYYYRKSVMDHTIGNMIDTPIEQLWGNKRHRSLIKQIKREECAMVDCKFFKHHALVDNVLQTGTDMWL